MDGVLIVGHGSRRPEAGRALAEVASMLDGEPGRLVRCAAMQLAAPSISEALSCLVQDGATRIAVVPLFLFSGQHVRDDIPELIAAERTKYPGVEISVSQPIGADARLADIVADRIEAVLPHGNGRALPRPGDIETESRRLIDARLPYIAQLPPDQREICRRVVHAGGDLGLARLVKFGAGGIEAGVGALRAGAAIVTDVAMVRAGVRERALQWGNQVVCRLPDERDHSDGEVTRTAAGVRRAVLANPGAVVAVGNAPTALFELIRLVSAGEAAVGLVVGCPVGFVGAAQSKELLVDSGIPFVTVTGSRGGSALAAAIINGLVDLAGGDRHVG